MKNILIVEDDRFLLEELTNTYKANSFNVYNIINFENIYEEIQLMNFDLIVLDINLPYRSGYEVLSFIKDTTTTPVLILTSRTNISDELKGFDLGADEFLTKPVDIKRLIARSNKLLNLYEKFGPIIKANDLIFDTSTNKLSYQNNFVILSQSEGDILQDLMKSYPDVVSKDDLLKAAWNTSYIDENILQVNLTRLRKKLTALGLDKVIVNVRGVGYKLDLESI